MQEHAGREKGNLSEARRRHAQEILLLQGNGPIPALVEAAKRIHESEGWQTDPGKVRHFHNVLITLGEFGPAAQEAIPVLELWQEDEIPKDVLQRIRLESLAKLIEVVQTPPAKFQGERHTALRFHSEGRVKAVTVLERLGLSAASALPALEGLLNDDDIALRYCAVRAIHSIDATSGAISAFRQRSSLAESRPDTPAHRRSDPDPYLAWLYFDFSDFYRPNYRTLERTDLEKLEANLRSPNWNLAKESLTELVERDQLEKCLPTLIEVFPRNRPEAHDPIGRMIVEALGRLGPKARPAIPVLLDGLESKSERFIGKALLLVASDAPEYVPHMRDALAIEKARFAADPRHWQQNQFVLAYLLWKNARSADAMATLVGGLRAKEGWERELAIMLLGEIGSDATAGLSHANLLSQ